MSRPPRNMDRSAMLASVAGLGAVTAEALAVLDGSTPASARGRLAAAESAGLASSWRLVRSLPPLYTVTRRGLRAAGERGLSPARVSPGGASHAVAAASAAAELATAFPDCEVLGEPAIRRWERERGRPLAALLGTGAAGHRPDLLLVRPSAGGPSAPPVAVEVELTVKAPVRLTAICRAWARSREVSGAIYLAAQPVLEPLARAIAEAGAEDRVVALRLDSSR